MSQGKGVDFMTCLYLYQLRMDMDLVPEHGVRERIAGYRIRHVWCPGKTETDRDEIP